MTSENKEIINDILSSPNRIRESYIKNNYPEFHQLVLNNILINNLPIGISFKEKLWYFINNITDEVVCKFCNNKVKFNRNIRNGYKLYCSSKCSQKNPETKRKREETNIKRYGVDNIAKLQESKNKTEETNIKKYGTKSSFQNKKVREKWRKGIKEKYGYDHIFQLESVKKQIKETNIKRYGVEYYVQSDDYKKHLIDINHSGNMKYIYNTNTILTNIKRYGVKHYTQSERYKEKMNSSNMKKYLKEKSFENRYEKFKMNFPEYKLIESNGKNVKILSLSCGHEYYILSETFYKRYYNGHNCCKICLPLNSISQSSLEISMREFLDSINIKYLPNHIIDGIEIDIYIPDHKLGIEMNGNYWHSELKKHRMFHKTKTEICEKNEIQLLHIWEDNWLYKKDIIKSIILNKLNLIKNRIYGRKCKVKEVNPKDTRLFLDNNHIQGYSNSKIKLGLYHNDKLVSLMTFGERNINGKRETELIRFCNILNTNVIGGGSKLFKHYINNYKWKSIKSYADISMFDGNLYNKLGFKYIHRSMPNYFWVVDGIRKHRFNYNKKKLISEGFDHKMTEKILFNIILIIRQCSGQDLYIYTL